MQCTKCTLQKTKRFRKMIHNIASLYIPIVFLGLQIDLVYNIFFSFDWVGTLLYNTSFLPLVYRRGIFTFTLNTSQSLPTNYPSSWWTPYYSCKADFFFSTITSDGKVFVHSCIRSLQTWVISSLRTHLLSAFKLKIILLSDSGRGNMVEGAPLFSFNKVSLVDVWSM